MQRKNANFLLDKRTRSSGYVQNTWKRTNTVDLSFVRWNSKLFTLRSQKEKYLINHGDVNVRNVVYRSFHLICQNDDTSWIMSRISWRSYFRAPSHWVENPNGLQNVHSKIIFNLKSVKKKQCISYESRLKAQCIPYIFSFWNLFLHISSWYV